MKYDIEFPQRTRLETAEQRARLNIIGKLQRSQVAALSGVGGKIRNHHIGAAAPVQFPQQGATDETSAAGDEHPASLPDIGVLIFRSQLFLSAKHFISYLLTTE